MNEILRRGATVGLAAAMSLTLQACDYFVSTQARMDKAVQLRAQGDYRAAAIELKKILQKQPDNRDARLLLGNISLQKGEAAAAEKELRRARDLGIPEEKVLIPLGRALLVQGRYDRALEELDLSGIEGAEARKAALMLRGEAYLSTGQVEDAEHAFRQALSLSPDSPDARIGLALVAQHKGDVESAEAYIGEALAKAPGFARAWLARGELELVRNQYARAEEAFTGALGVAGLPVVEEFIARNGLAESQWRQGKSAAALQTVESLLAMQLQHPRPRYFRALIAYGAGDYKTAKEYLQEVLRDFPNYRPASLLLGATHYAKGELEQADMHLSSVLAAEPASVPARKLLAATRLRQHKAQDAIATLTPVLADHGDDGPLLALLGKASLQAGDTDAGFLYLDRGARSDPQNQGLQMELATTYVAAGDLGRAIGLLEQMPETKDGAYGRELLLILAYLRRGDSANALALANKLVAGRPDDAGAHNLAGSACMLSGQLQRAREHFEKALELQPDSIAVLMNLGRLDLRQARQDSARGRFERVLAINPKNVSAMLALAGLSSQRGDDAGVGEWLERASAAEPQAVTPKLLLIQHYVEARDFPRARGVAEELAKSEPANADAQNALGIVQMSEDRFADAAASFRRAVAAAPKSPGFAYNLARAELAQERPGEAKKLLARTLELQPRHLPATVTLAVMEMREGNAEQALARARWLQQERETAGAGRELEGDLRMMQRDFAAAALVYESMPRGSRSTRVAIKAYQSRSLARLPDAVRPLQVWLHEHPDDARARLALAEGYQERGAYKLAAAEYERVLASYPDNALTLNNLAWVYHLAKDPRAIETAERAHMLQPDNGAIADTLGWLLVEVGQAERGLEHLRKASQQAPDIPDIRYHLAVALAKTGSSAEARRTLAELVGSGKNFKDMKEAKELLRQL